MGEYNGLLALENMSRECEEAFFKPRELFADFFSA